MNEETLRSDLTGRVLSLEQRVRGLEGRVSALEARVSGEPVEDDVELVAAWEEPGHGLEARINALEARAPVKGPGAGRGALEITGLLGGMALIGVALLLWTGSMDALKNPLLAFAAGVALLAGGGWRALKR